MHQSPIRVLFYEPYSMGCGGNFFTQRLILERLDRKKFLPIVVAPVDGVALERFRKMGVECAVIPPPGYLGRYGGALLRLGILSKLKSVFDLVRYNLVMAEFLRDRKIDVVYANSVRAQMSIGMAAWAARVPSLLYIKGELVNPIIDRLSLATASKILFFCEQNRNDRYPYLIHWLRRKIDILRIGMDPMVVEEVQNYDHTKLRQELAIQSDHFNVIVLGQLYPNKGQHLAIEALANLITEFPQLQLYLVGDHVIEEYRSYKTELLALIDRYGLTRNVRFTGWRKDALAITSLMDLVVHPSLAEGFGRAVLESMALGKPVIASAVGGLREAIRDGHNGYLVAPGDVEAITLRWRELLSEPELRRQLGEEARRTVFTDYLIDDKVARIAKIWAEMAKQRNGTCAALPAN